MRKTFEAKVKSMTGSQILRAMIKGLKKECVKVDMGTFGSVKKVDNKKICVGCAATNAICEISGVTPDPSDFQVKTMVGLVASKTSSDVYFLQNFEYAIDELRKGDVDGYNSIARRAGFSEIVVPSSIELPYLDNSNYKAMLPFYEALAKFSEGVEKEEYDEDGYTRAVKK